MADPGSSAGNDLRDEMKAEVPDLFAAAIAKFNSENEIAQEICRVFQKKAAAKGAWHCVVGRSFGSSVTFDERTHFAGQFGQFWVEIWRCG
jgi:dynein light chain LC8-type